MGQLQVHAPGIHKEPILIIDKWNMTDTPKTRPGEIPRQEMPRQDPEVRACNFEEVALGYTEELAVAEAKRCIRCKKPVCVSGCPVAVQIPEFIAMIAEGDFAGAIQKIKETNSLPAVCGRVCPQEDQCEKKCTLGFKFEPVAIGRLERFAADRESASGKMDIPTKAPPTGKKIAVVGSGPAGLTAAGELCKMGHEVTIFEALHKSGGVLAYGIPEFRLPKKIVQNEVDFLIKMGVEVKTNYVIGQIATVDELLTEEGYDAVFLGTGAGLPYFMGIPGENLNGVYSANEFLTRANLMKAYLFPEHDTPIKRGKRVAVIGGGNVAMDSARTALRLGADSVTIVYRRSRKELPAREEEVENAEEEGIQFKLLTSPLKIMGDEKGWVTSMECRQMELGEPDCSGRRRPVPIEGSEFIMETDIVIIAIGQGANPLISTTTKDLKTNKYGYITADEETGQTSKKNVYAGGDIVTGAATVILAMGAGRNSAKTIDASLNPNNSPN
jgi:glutamate synthase (NADPH/NADH) small chain